MELGQLFKTAYTAENSACVRGPLRRFFKTAYTAGNLTPTQSFLSLIIETAYTAENLARQAQAGGLFFETAYTAESDTGPFLFLDMYIRNDLLGRDYRIEASWPDSVIGNSLCGRKYVPHHVPEHALLRSGLRGRELSTLLRF